MEENTFPQKKEFNDKPLGWGEKIKLGLLKLLFGSSDKIKASENRIIQSLQEKLEDLERRNQSEVEKLMELFKNNPDEALKYAIPLDGEGTTRGGNMARFEM